MQRLRSLTNMAEDTQKSDIHKKIKSAFESFDYQLNNTVDVREIGTIIYSLGCFPSQADINNLIAEVEDDQSGFVHLERFLPAMTKVLMENKFPPIPKDLVLQAFEVLDKQKKGYLDAEELTKYLTQEGTGEVFNQNEMDEMLFAFADSEKNIIDYKDVIDQLTFDTE